MIKQEVLTSVIPLCDRLYKAGLRLNTDERSPVQALNIAAYTPVVDTFVGETGFIEAWTEALALDNTTSSPSAVTMDGDEEAMAFIPTNDYRETLDSASTYISDAVLRGLNHAKNVATPAINAVFDSVEEIMSLQTSAREDVEIIEANDAEAWSNPIIVGAYSRHTGRVDRVQTFRCPIPENIEEVLMSGSANLDKIYKDLLAELGLTASEAVAMLLDGAEHGHWPQPMYKYKNNVLLNFITASLLIAKPLPNSGVSLDQWEATLYKLQNTYGVLCSDIAESTKTLRDANDLVLDVQTPQKRIVVDGLTYDKWLNAGGSPEILIGAFVARTSIGDMTYDGLIEKAEVYKGHWKNYHSVKQYNLETNRLNRLREAVLSSLLAQLDELDKELLPTQDMDQLYANIKTAISSLQNWHLDDISNTVVSLVCGTLFPHTQAQFFIERMTARKDDGYDQQTAETMVIAEYITNWVMGSTYVEKAL